MVQKRIEYSATRFFGLHRVKVIESDGQGGVIGVKWFSNFMTAAKYIFANCLEGPSGAWRYKVVYPAPKGRRGWMKAYGDEIVDWMRLNWHMVWMKGSEGIVMEGAECLPGEEKQYDIQL